MLLLGTIAALLIGSYGENIKDSAFFIICAVIVLLKIFRVLILSDSVEKSTLWEYENGGVTYKVTKIRVEDNKATDIEVIHNLNNN